MSLSISTHVLSPYKTPVQSFGSNPGLYAFQANKRDDFRLRFSATQQTIIPETHFPATPQLKVQIFAFITALLGPHTPQKTLLKSTFPIAKGSIDKKDAPKHYLAMPKLALNLLQSKMGTLPGAQTFDLKIGMHPQRVMPVLYLPPKGKQPTIILSPGAMGRLNEYVPFMQSMYEKGYGIVAYQFALLNSKQTYALDKKHNFAKMEERFIRDLDALSTALHNGYQMPNGKRVEIPYAQQILAGHSTGGSVSAALAARYPQRHYPALTLLGTPLNFQNAFLHIVQNKVRPSIYNLLPKKRMSAFFKDSFDLRHMLPQVKAPVLYIQGNQDKTTRADVYVAWKKLIPPHAQAHALHVIPDAPHDMLLGQVLDKTALPPCGQQVGETMDAFLKAHIQNGNLR